MKRIALLLLAGSLLAFAGSALATGGEDEPGPDLICSFRAGYRFTGGTKLNLVSGTESPPATPATATQANCCVRGRRLYCARDIP